MELTLKDKKDLGEYVLRVFTNFDRIFNYDDISIDGDSDRNTAKEVSQKKALNALRNSDDGFEKVVAALSNGILNAVEYGWIAETDEVVADPFQVGSYTDEETKNNRYKSLALFQEALSILSDECRKYRERISVFEK